MAHSAEFVEQTILVFTEWVYLIFTAVATLILNRIIAYSTEFIDQTISVFYWISLLIFTRLELTHSSNWFTNI